MSIHRFKVKVYYEDTDAAGVVYYANYLRYMERARTEFLLEKGIDVAEHHNGGILFAVLRVEIDYKKPARLGVIIEVVTEVTETSRVTISLRQDIFKDDKLLVEGAVRLACIDGNGKPRRLPEEFSALSSE